ncbi:putative DNA helicase ino80 [Apophysomyces ossiformis]|uniref:Chromatin-remodeling ATPase INO80 n=1 Tax=Apophysomyces ossiformis TaxID=679940 RepID=A0A8H7BRB4_9FUNG|nr:putative DNA helicase ino80 [Apophysomyces ossiformis]
MSFDRQNQAQQGQQAPSDHPHRLQPRQDISQRFRPIPYQAQSSEEWDMYARQSSTTNTSFAGPGSLAPPPTAQYNYPHSPTQTDYAQREPYQSAPTGPSATHGFAQPSSSSAWEYPERRYPDRPLPQASLQTHHRYPPSVMQTSRDYPHSGSGSLPFEMSTETRYLQRPIQPVQPTSSVPYDPVRNPSADAEMASDQTRPAATPVMSISQLLSSDASERPYQPTYASAEKNTALTETPELEKPSAENDQSSSSNFRNGIRNLLNSPSEEGYQMADSDTDTEDIPLIRSSANETGNIQDVDSDEAGTKFIKPPTYSRMDDTARQLDNEDISTTEIASFTQEQSGTRSPITASGANHRHLYDMSDDSSLGDISDREIDTTSKKSLFKKTLEDLGLSDEDEEEMLHTHREQMVEYMIEIHRRKKMAIEEYEKKRVHKQAKMKEHLRRLYEKRQENGLPRQLGDGFNGNITTSLLLKAVKDDQDRLSRKMRKAKRRKAQAVETESVEDEYGDTDVSDQEIAVTRPKIVKPTKRMENERRKIWLSIARKDIPRMARILSRVQATRSGNCKKIAQYCQKEAKRAATKGGRANRDVQTKAKRAMKEMLVFWKKNEKEERELRKKAEKEALERLRLEEERREAQRQARKLNFLITQTELYSHFIGRKIKQDVGEDEDTAVQSDGYTPTVDTETDDLDLDVESNVQPMGEIDFDEDDEEKLREQARRGAQSALAKQRERTRAFDEGARERRLAAGDSSAEMAVTQADFDSMNFQDPSSMGTGPEIKQPAMLMCQLKSYQLKGLNWLGNLYEQGINGILADEMGLGKTVQSISLMAYLAEVHNIWGPFLVIAPASTLHNWQQEITKFVPSFRALPYWGNPKDRKVLRQFWNRKQLYGRDAPFHIVITSYQLVLTDVSYFQRVKWQYMILDEAQAIKSSSSARWKQLLGFHCRNRLLLTGTPIQNSMQELWALLHFIMPTLFDSHEEFSEWFSKDIESHAENKGTLNEHQLRRLHMILKPFMLRRIKRNVQHELGEKIEVEVYCDLTARQRALYRGLKEKISISELLEKATSLNDTESMDSLMNLVMQFRKVCNHPELFERADVQSPLAFCEFSSTGSLTKESLLYCSYSARSHIKYHIPKRLYKDGGILRAIGPNCRGGFTTRYLDNLMNIWTSDYIHESSNSSDTDAGFSFLRFIDMSPHEASYLFKKSIVARWIAHLAVRDKRARRRFYVREDESYPDAPVNTYAMFLIAETVSPLFAPALACGGVMDRLTHVPDKLVHLARQFDQCYMPGARSVPVDVICSDIAFEYDQRRTLFDTAVRACLFGNPQYISHERETAANLASVVRKTDVNGIMPVSVSGHGYSLMRVPAMKDLILDSGKLATLDKLLERLKAEGHRCLIYFQMTRMIDLMEEYISYKQYKYMRLDGSSKISDRRDMVQDWQTRPEIFIFLLSTRAGGLGINLTAADTVIFYDSDWNPTVDQQAMDRAHRLGQTKQVTVYRLITKGTIEERILMRAKQKDEIQKVVISGGEFKQVDFKPREIVSLLLDDEELDNKLQQQLKRKAEEDEKKKTARPSKRSRKSNGSSESTPAASPFDVDRLFSAGADTLPEDNSSPSPLAGQTPKKKSSRIGRPRTNISFTG